MMMSDLKSSRRRKMEYLKMVDKKLILVRTNTCKMDKKLIMLRTNTCKITQQVLQFETLPLLEYAV
jgi:hypothetical protein